MADGRSVNWDSMTDTGSTIVVGLLVGIVFLWLVSLLADRVYTTLRPLLPFLVFAAFVGALVIHWVSKI